MKKKCGCGLCTTHWKLKYTADLQGSWENYFSRDTHCPTRLKNDRVQMGGNLLDPQNTVGAKQVDKTVQLQTHTNYVLQLLYCRLWMRWEWLSRRFIFQRFKEMKCNEHNALGRSSGRECIIYLLVCKDLHIFLMCVRVLSVLSERNDCMAAPANAADSIGSEEVTTKQTFVT